MSADERNAILTNVLGALLILTVVVDHFAAHRLDVTGKLVVGILGGVLLDRTTFKEVILAVIQKFGFGK